MHRVTTLVDDALRQGSVVIVVSDNLDSDPAPRVRDLQRGLSAAGWSLAMDRGVWAAMRRRGRQVEDEVEFGYVDGNDAIVASCKRVCWYMVGKPSTPPACDLLVKLVRAPGDKRRTETLSLDEWMEADSGVARKMVDQVCSAEIRGDAVRLLEFVCELEMLHLPFHRTGTPQMMAAACANHLRG
jgi:hypothetical protein